MLAPLLQEAGRGPLPSRRRCSSRTAAPSPRAAVAAVGLRPPALAPPLQQSRHSPRTAAAAGVPWVPSRCISSKAMVPGRRC